MWHNLEIFELADLTALAWNVASMDVKRKGDEEVGDYLVGLSDAEARPINRIESELVVGVDRLTKNVEKAGVPLAQAGCVAIDAGLGPTLVFELCKLLLCLGRSGRSLDARLAELFQGARRAGGEEAAARRRRPAGALPAPGARQQRRAPRVGDGAPPRRRGC